MESAIIDHNLKRVSATINPDFPKAIKFAEKLGFKKEGVMRNFGPLGEDYLIYVKV